MGGMDLFLLSRGPLSYRNLLKPFNCVFSYRPSGVGVLLGLGHW